MHTITIASLLERFDPDQVVKFLVEVDVNMVALELYSENNVLLRSVASGI